MMNSRAVAPERLQVFGRAVAGIAFPAVVRMLGRELPHQPVTVFLGNDRGSGNAGLAAIAADNGAGSSWHSCVATAGSGRRSIMAGPRSR